MKRIHLILCAAGAAMTMAACNSVDFKKTSAGVPYKVFVGNGSKDSLPATGIIKFNVIQRVKDSVLFSSYKEGRPQYIPVSQVLNGTARGYTDFEGNFSEIMRKARKGDSLYIVMAADSFLKTPSPMPLPFKKGDEILTTIRIVDVFKTEAEAQEDQKKVMEPLLKKQQEEAQKAQAAEAGLIQDYIQKNMPKATKTPSGLYYEVLQEGSGAFAKNGQQVDIKYRGTHLDGNKFDEGTFPLTIGSGSAVQGFDEAAQLLNKGRKIRVLMPSALGYGAQGRPPIKPYEPLVFEMEAMKIGAPEAAPAMPQPVVPDSVNR